AAADAPAIARLKAKGFIVLGRGNMTEFAYSGVGLNPHYGTPRSPYDRRTGRIPGGSSSGGAVAVADGLVSLAIGSDTGGSCRIPSAYNGIVGYKPSTGLIPLTGAFPLSPSLDSIGPLANSVACCAVTHAIMADRPAVTETADAKGLRLGILRDYVLDDLEKPVATAFDGSLARLAAAGVGLSDARFPEITEIPVLNGRASLLVAEAWQGHRARIAAKGEGYDPRVRMRLELGKQLTAADLLDTMARRAALIARFSAFARGFDALIMPTVPMLPPAIADLAQDADYVRLNAMSLRNTTLFNFLDGCSISIPMTARGEAPVGFMLVAAHGCDDRLFAAAQAVEGIVRPR
ncbi:MAG: amidase, partial [Alphaproteobacteria bacterium]|nr:amidase [Alphaproteobacteria bacterium]